MFYQLSKEVISAIFDNLGAIFIQTKFDKIFLKNLQQEIQLSMFQTY